MVLIFNGKQVTSVKLCTKAGNSPYNKGGQTVWVEKDRIVGLYDYRDAKLVILRPVIDKLVFEYSFQDFKKKTHTDDLREAVLKNLKKVLAQTKPDFTTLVVEDVGFKRFKELSRTHKQCLLLVHKPSGSKIIFQIDPRKKNGPFLRCDLNPARLGPEGMAFFAKKLNGLLMVKPHVISFDNICKIPKLIKRIDIAVDMLGVDASDLEGRYVFKDKKLKQQSFHNPTGRLQTQYFVKDTYDENQAYWYNKQKQTIEDKAYDVAPSPYGKSLCTRYEYRIQETDKPIANLHSLLNHLPKVHFRAVDYTKIAHKDYVHPLFLRYAITRTRDKALQMIPDEYQSDFKATYDGAMLDIWNPEEIWEKGWTQELIYLGLLDAETLKEKKTKKKQS